jgi:hypothetical protein
MRSALRNSLAAPIALSLLLGCSKSATRPATPDVRLSVTASPAAGRPSEPTTIELSVRNAGDATVWHCEGCGCGNGSAITILGPDGNEVVLTDPLNPVPACADRVNAALDPGGVIESHLVFEGTLYVEHSPTYPSPTYAAPPGVYTVVARFDYWPPMNASEQTKLERRTTFQWGS